jgi:hypothetical protein
MHSVSILPRRSACTSSSWSSRAQITWLIATLGIEAREGNREVKKPGESAHFQDFVEVEDQAPPGRPTAFTSKATNPTPGIPTRALDFAAKQHRRREG